MSPYAIAGATDCGRRSHSDRLLFALALLLAGAAQAQEVYVTNGGATYALGPIEGGSVLVNADDPADEITITQDCGAHHPAYGNGSWAWDGAGVVAVFSKAELRLDGPMPLPAADC